jgi:heat shock protein HtpX
MQSVYSHIDKNKRTTLIVMICFAAIITFIGWFVGQYYFEGSGVAFVGFALIFSGITSFISYYNSDKMVLAISGAKEVPFEVSPDLHKLVDNMCIASGLPKPKIYMIDDSAPNAFATGRDPEHAVLCFTTGIVHKLEKRELEGVIAHELSHIQNYDILLMSVVSILVGSVTLLADWFSRGMFYGGRKKSSKSSGGILMIVGLVLIILSPIIATLIKLAISRNREFLADASAVMLTRHPKGLTDALIKISSDKDILEAANGATAHLYISNPLKGKSNGMFANLFNTHPPVEERINRLQGM